MHSEIGMYLIVQRNSSNDTSKPNDVTQKLQEYMKVIPKRVLMPEIASNDYSQR
jgi:hypothetical protein